MERENESIQCLNDEIERLMGREIERTHRLNNAERRAENAEAKVAQFEKN